MRLIWPSNNASLLWGLRLEQSCESPLDQSLDTWKEGPGGSFLAEATDPRGWSRGCPEPMATSLAGNNTPQLPFLLGLPSGEALIKFGITMCKAQSEFCLLCHVTCLSKHSVRAAVNLLTRGLTGRWPGGPTKFLPTLCYLAWQGETPCLGSVSPPPEHFLY